MAAKKRGWIVCGILVILTWIMKHYFRHFVAVLIFAIVMHGTNQHAMTKDVSDLDVLAKISKDIDELIARNGQPKYATSPSPKALAACIDWDGLNYQGGQLIYRLPFDVNSPVRYYQYSFGKPSLAEARDRALKGCQDHETGCKCAIFYSNDQIVYSLPTGLLARLNSQRKEEEQFTIVLDNIERRIAGSSVPKVQNDLVLGPGRDLRVMPIACEHSYICSCHKRLRADLIPMPLDPMTAERLKRIQSTGFYDCREVSSLPPGDAIFPYQRKVCHFVAMKKEPQRLVGLVSSTVATQTFEEVLYEVAIPVDDDFDPIDEPIEGRRVVYARRGDIQYLGVVRELAWDGNVCAVSFPFVGEAFDLTACKKATECATKAVSSLCGAIREQMTKAPFMTEPVPVGLLIPGELSFQRKRKPSQILQGPFWELNTYNLNWWRAGERTSSGFPDQEKYRGVSEQGDRIYVRMTSSILVAVANGKYREPEPNQQDKYEGLLRSAYRSALQRTCSELRGRLNGDICELSSD